jgi:hypothetical protein
MRPARTKILPCDLFLDELSSTSPGAAILVEFTSHSQRLPLALKGFKMGYLAKRARFIREIAAVGPQAK